MYLTVPQTEGIFRQAKELPNFKTMNIISTSGKFSRAPWHWSWWQDVWLTTAFVRKHINWHIT